MSGAAAASGGAAAPLFAASPNSLVALRNSLIDAPKLLPISGNRFGPNTTKTTASSSTMCHGSSPNIGLPSLR